MMWMTFMGFAVVSAGVMLFNAGRSSDNGGLVIGGVLVGFLGFLLLCYGIGYNIGYRFG